MVSSKTGTLADRGLAGLPDHEVVAGGRFDRARRCIIFGLDRWSGACEKSRRIPQARRINCSSPFHVAGPPRIPRGGDRSVPRRGSCESLAAQNTKANTTMVHCRMRNFSVIGAIMTVLCWFVGASAWALEFTADQITRTDGQNRKANLYYRDDRWRLEHQELSPVNVTIVRKDKQVVWLLLSRMRHFKTVPYDPEQSPKVSEQLDGEIAREEIGTEILDGHPTTLYQVTARHGAGTDVYYQWLATDIRFPLKLARKDGLWQVEYRNVKLHRVSDSLFELPVNFQPLEDFDQVQQSKQKQTM